MPLKFVFFFFFAEGADFSTCLIGDYRDVWAATYQTCSVRPGAFATRLVFPLTFQEWGTFGVHADEQVSDGHGRAGHIQKEKK